MRLARVKETMNVRIRTSWLRIALLIWMATLGLLVLVWAQDSRLNLMMRKTNVAVIFCFESKHDGYSLRAK